MDLPLLLAGPILRRIEPNSVSVWVALSRPSVLTLTVWEGLVESGHPDPFLAGTAKTIRIGDKLHIAVVTAASIAKTLEADSLYSYDIAIDVQVEAGEPAIHHTLATLKLLESGPANLPLGYEAGKLPSFAPCPSKLEDLNILFGSCRRPSHPDPDALAMVDDLIEGPHKKPSERPHQLLLGGDQIYADDVSLVHMLLVMARAGRLIGIIHDLNSDEAEDVGVIPVEHAALDAIRSLDKAASTETTATYNLKKGADTLPVDRHHFPEEGRLSTTIRDAQFTSTDGANHIISLGEFAALYLSVWSTALWGDEVPALRYKADDPLVAERPIRWDEELPAGGQVTVPGLSYPEKIPANLYFPTEEYKEQVADLPVILVHGTHGDPWRVEWGPSTDPPTPKLKKERKQLTAAEATEEATKEQEKKDSERQKDLRNSLRNLQEFWRGLPRVQRALANVPTYMILDDHDVTDDYFLSPIWRDRVLTSALGQTILRNAMLAYALFQDWGNDPDKYRGGQPAELLAEAQKLFPADLQQGPDPDASDKIARLLGHDLRNKPLGDGRFEPVKPPLTWHFMVDGPKHRVIALDNRTRRSYASNNGPPGNVSAEALADQVPKPPLPAGREILVVVAPLQVIGPPVLDDIVAPLSFRASDIGGIWSTSNLSSKSSTGMRQLIGTDPDAIEAWAFDAVSFEHLLELLAPYERVVLLSGDVHYSASSIMSYWRGNAARPARFAQFTSSGLKNVMPPKVTFADRSAGFAQQMIRANVGAERVAWMEPKDDLILFPACKSASDLMPGLRSKLKSTPVLLPTWGWLDLNDRDHPESADPEKICRLNPARPPDWAWRVEPLLDRRPETERPASIRVAAIDEAALDAKLADKSTVGEAYLEIARRHQHSMMRLRNARQILFRANVGQVRFERSGDALDAIHRAYTTFVDPDDVAPPPGPPKPEPFMVQVAHLGPLDEPRPATLRRRAIPDGPAGGS